MAITGGAAAVTTNATNANGSVTSPSITLTAGRQLLVAVAWEMGSGVTNDRSLNGVTLSGGGTVTMIGSPLAVTTGGRNGKMQMGYIASIGQSGAQTVAVAAMTGSNTVAATAILVREWQGGDTAAFFDAAGTGNIGDGSDAILADSIVTSFNNDAIFGVYYWTAGNLVGITGSSLTWTNMTMTDLFSKVDCFECLDVGSTGTKAPSVEIDAFANMMIWGAGFKSSGSVGSGGVPKSTRFTMLGIG